LVVCPAEAACSVVAMEGGLQATAAADVAEETAADVAAPAAPAAQAVARCCGLWQLCARGRGLRRTANSERAAAEARRRRGPNARGRRGRWRGPKRSAWERADSTRAADLPLRVVKLAVRNNWFRIASRNRSGGGLYVSVVGPRTMRNQHAIMPCTCVL